MFFWIDNNAVRDNMHYHDIAILGFIVVKLSDPGAIAI